jgi:aminoglycoside phosphotransferase (APT) family kinase protein
MASKIYKELEFSDLQKIVKDLHGETAVITKHHILKGGLFNTTYFIKTNCNNGLVLRVAPINKHLLLEFEQDMMSTEPLFGELLHKNGIPTSKVLKYAPKGSVIDREYIIMEYIESVPISSIGKFGAKSIYKEAGSLTAKIHLIKNDKFGWVRGHNNLLFDTWCEFIRYFANELTEKAKTYDLLRPDDIVKFNLTIDSAKNILNEIKEPRVVHADLWQGNVLVDKKNYKIMAIIDLDRTIFGDRFWDLSSPWIINKAFLAGYGEALPNDNNHKIRARIYRLIATLLGAYVWKAQYDNPKMFKNEQRNLLKTLNDTP